MERDHEVTAFPYMAHTGKTFEVDGVNVKSGKAGISAAWRLAERADVVVSHIGDGGRGATAARKAGVPNVQLQHGPVARVKSPDLLVFNSEWMRLATPHECPSIVCPPVVDPAEFATTPGNNVTIVNLSEAKGIRTAWKAAERIPDLPFLGVSGGYGSQVHPRAKNFEVIPTTRNMRDDVYARTRILLVPSEAETWGMVGVEAMCSGIPVIAHPNNGLRESLGSAGIFVDRADTDGWVREIERLQDPGEYARASRAALRRVAELDPAPTLARFADAVEALV